MISALRKGDRSKTLGCYGVSCDYDGTFCGSLVFELLDTVDDILNCT